MTTAVIDEIVTKVNEMTDADRAELLRRLSQPTPAKRSTRKAPKKGIIRPENPNLTWIKANSDDYKGNYVALQDGKLIAYGRTIKEADQAAKAKGVSKPFLHYIMGDDEIAWWGGWM
jgi:hypothetical protein